MANKTNAFSKNIKRLIGQNCWSVIAGKGTGSNIALDFGKKILRKTEIKNDYLSEEQRKYVGEFSLYITCSWRLDSDTGVICGSKEPNQNDGPMIEGIKKITTKNIIDIEILSPAFDLLIQFEGRLTLRLFCDETDPIDEFDNYSLYTPEGIYTISNRSNIIIEDR